MKNLVFIFALLFASNVALADRDGREGGGGGIVAAEFAATGRSAINLLAEGDSSINVKKALEAVGSTKLVPVEEICFETSGIKYCEDAHYDAKTNTIFFNKKTWKNFSCTQMLVLSAHEYLRVSGLEKEDYGLSGRFLSGKVAVCTLNGCADLTVSVHSKIHEFCEQAQLWQADINR